MTWLEFRDFLLRHLWREGDTDLQPDVELFVRLGEGRMNRDMLIEDRSNLLATSANSTTYTLPADCAVVRAVTSSVYGPFSYLTPSAFSRLNLRGQHNIASHYTVQGRDLRLSGPISATNPLAIDIEYYENIPSLVDTGGSYVLDQYFDLYLYAVLSHTATYLREDPRLAVWKAEYQEALNSVLDFNDKVKYSQGPLTMPLPGNVA